MFSNTAVTPGRAGSRWLRANVEPSLRLSLSLSLSFSENVKSENVKSENVESENTRSENVFVPTYLKTLQRCCLLMFGLLHRASHKVTRDQGVALMGALETRVCHVGKFGTVRRLRPLTANPGTVQTLQRTPARRAGNRKNYKTLQLFQLDATQT